MTDAHDDSRAAAPKADPVKVAPGYQCLMAFVLLFLVSVVMGVMNPPGSTLNLVAKGLGYLGTAVSIVGVVLVGLALHWHVAVVVIVAVLMFIDPLNWIVVIVQTIQAQEILRKGGYKIGFLFARKPKGDATGKGV